MSDVTLDPQWFNAYWPPFRSHIYELLSWGYEDAKDRIGQNHEEEEITGFIAEAIQERLMAPECPRWCEHYALKEDNPVPGQGRTGKRRKIPDFIFEHTIYPRPTYIFEAKRLRQNKNFRENYYFSKGLERFLHGEYATKCLEAGMIGYVQCDTPDKWQDRLKHYLDRDAEKDACKYYLKSYPKDESSGDIFAKKWVSEHARRVGANIVIYHILLDCLNQQS